MDATLGDIVTNELLICTSPLQSCRFALLSRVQKAIEKGLHAKIISFVDFQSAWSKAAERCNFAKLSIVALSSAASNQDNSKVSFVNGAALCAEEDVLENIENLVCSFGENDYVVLDGLDIVCSLLPDSETKNIKLRAFIDRLIDTERRLCVSLTPRKSEKEDEIFARYWAHNSDQVVILQNLKTGLASDVTGKLTVIRPEEDIKKEMLYKLGDRGVEIVTAGLISTSGRDDFSNVR